MNKNQNWKKNKRGGGRKPSTKSNNNNSYSAKPKSEFEGREEEPVNLPKWYMASESTKQAVERVSFNNIIGYPYQLDRYVNNVFTKESLLNPVFATVMVNPSIEPTKGVSKTNLNASALNRIANMCYVQWSAMSGRTSNYSPADIATYILACGSIQALISHIRRALGVARYYSGKNMTYPLEILKALHIELTGVTDRQILTYVDKLNFEIRLFNAIKFPKNLEYFNKCNTIFDRIYKDSEGSYSQDFAFVPYSVWKIKENYNDAGTGLETVLIAGDATEGANTLPALLNKLDDLITELTTSSTQALIGSDMLNYAMKKGMELGGIPELGYDYIVVPEYSAEACIQFHHTRPIGAPLDWNPQTAPNTNKNDVAPTKGGAAAALFVQYAPAFPVSEGSSVRPFIDIDTDNPNVDEIVEARRYLSCLTVSSTTPDRMPSHSGYLTDTYCVKIEVWGQNGESGTQLYLTVDESNNHLTAQSSILVPIILSAFNHAPIVPYLAGGYIHVFDQVSNIATLDDNYLTNVNHLEQMDLFTIRELQSFIKD